MGDRGNIRLVSSDGEVWFYSHWSGSDLPHIVQRALARRQRWGDDPYLNRIIFCELVKGHEADETGFGISTAVCDNSHPIVVVDHVKQRVAFSSDTETGKVNEKNCIIAWTFEEYIGLTKSKLEKAFRLSED